MHAVVIVWYLQYKDMYLIICDTVVHILIVQISNTHAPPCIAIQRHTWDIHWHAYDGNLDNR